MINSRPESLAYSPDGQTLAVGHVHWTFAFGTGGWVTLRDAATGEIKHELRGHAGGVDVVAYSADGRTLASGGGIDVQGGRRGNTVLLWDAETGAHLRSLEAYEWEVHTLTLSPDGRTLAIASLDGRLTLWDTATGTRKLHIEGHSGPISSVEFSPGRQHCCHWKSGGTFGMGMGLGRCGTSVECDNGGAQPYVGRA